MSERRDFVFIIFFIFIFLNLRVSVGFVLRGTLSPGDLMTQLFLAEMAMTGSITLYYLFLPIFTLTFLKVQPYFSRHMEIFLL